MLGIFFAFCRLSIKRPEWQPFVFNRVANSLDPDQARHKDGPDLSPNCLHIFSIGDTSKELKSVKCVGR